MSGTKKNFSIISDDEPLYDSVASDDDYASIGDNQSLKEVRIDGANNNNTTGSGDSSISSNPPTMIVKENGRQLSAQDSSTLTRKQEGGKNADEVWCLTVVIE